jgi:type II secretory pathway component GspD/PulD (secretin)
VARTANQVLVASDTPAKRRDFEPYVLKTYYLTNISSPQELQDMVNLLRTVFEVRFLVPQPSNNSIEIRAPQATLEAIDKFLPTLSPRQPEVVFDVEVFEVNRSLLQNIGVDLPLQFQVFNIGAAAIAALNSPSVQNLINQLLANGGTIDPNALAGLVGQLQNQQLSSLLQNPIATFGGGLTLFGVSVPPATVNFSRNESRATSIEHTTLRAQQGNAANLHIGTRLPVLTQSFTSGVQLGGIPGATVGQISGVVPGFQYEDLGMTVKATPAIHGTDSVTLNLEMTVKTAGAQQFNGVPVIQNREYKGYIRVRDGESTVMAGMVSRSESRAIRGLPGLANVPLLGQTVGTLSRNDTDSELLVIITPHIISARETTDQTIVMPKGQ